MNDNKFEDIFSENSQETAKEETVSGNAGMIFPKVPVQKPESGFNPISEEKPAAEVKVDRFFETVEKAPAAAPKKPEPTFNPYEPSRANAPRPQFNQNFSAPRPNPQPQNYGYVNPQYASQPMSEPPKKKGGKSVITVIIAICAVIAVALIAKGMLGGSSNTGVSTTAPAPTVNEEVQTSPQVSTTKPNKMEEVNSVWVAEKVRPSVVGVMTYKNGQLSGEGSGVLWMEDGEYTYVITCAHVIDESGVSYGVLLLDGRNYEATLVGSDARTDIGVVKIKATGLPLAELGDSTTLKIGEPVYAIGNPGGSEYFGSFTDGIVSAIDRSVTATYKMTCIQHNAAINPGNSGGALVNSAGQIIGINSSKIASTEYEGMGFAVPTSIAKPIAEALVNYSYVPNRPKLGIEYASVSSYQLYSMVVSIKGLPQGSLVIAGISSDSSLVGTEAQVGDLIIGVNGKDMNNSSVLLDLIETGAVGDTLTLTLCRIDSRTYQTKTFDVTITLVEDRPQEEAETTQPSYNGDGYYYGGASDFEDFFDDYFFGW